MKIQSCGRWDASVSERDSSSNPLKSSAGRGSGPCGTYAMLALSLTFRTRTKISPLMWLDSKSNAYGVQPSRVLTELHSEVW